MLTDSEKYEYKRLLDLTSTLYDSQDLSEIAQNSTIIDREVGHCPTVLEKFHTSNFAKEIIPGCVESCSRKSSDFQKFQQLSEMVVFQLTLIDSLERHSEIIQNELTKEPFTL